MSRAARKIEAEIRAECERNRPTLWTDARWYEHVSQERVQEIVMEYGYGPLRDSMTRLPTLPEPSGAATTGGNE